MVSPGTALDLCGDAGPEARAANDATPAETVLVLPRMVAIGLRKYAEIPAQRGAAVRLILRNAIRMAQIHLGRTEAAALALETLREGGQ